MICTKKGNLTMKPRAIFTGSIFLLFLLATTAFSQEQHMTNKERAALAGAYRQARSIGDLAGAKQIQVQQIIPSARGASGEYLEASKLCFELGEYDQAKKYLREFMKLDDLSAEAPLFSASVVCFQELLGAAANHRSPNWNQITRSYPDVASADVLRVVFSEAIGGMNFKLATFALQELERLGVSSRSIAIDKANLKRAVEELAKRRKAVKP